MKRNSRRSKQLGQTIIEVIVATGILGLVMTAVVAIVSVSVRNAARAKAKAMGTKYTQEGIEYFRAQRNIMGWESFLAEIQEGGPVSAFCLATLPYNETGGLEDLPDRPCLSNEFVEDDDIFKRSAQVSVANVGGQDVITVTVEVEWPDGGRTTTSTATVELQKSQN